MEASVEPSLGVEDPVESRERRKELKRLGDANRSLDSWERYRALNDSMDEAYELVGIANREARFAAILMGALNTAVVVLITRPEVHAMIPLGFRPWLGAMLTIYAVAAVYFFLSAIEILRPRRYRPRLPEARESEAETRPMGVRYYEDVALRDAAGHLAAWRVVRIGQLNAELAVQLHSLSLVNKSKYASVRRLYSGLRVMTVIAAAVTILLGFFVFRGST